MGVSRRRNLLLGWALALGAMALFAALGHWQLQRRHEKLAMLEAAQRVLAARAAQPLAVAADPSRMHAYAWAAGDGHFIDTRAVLLDNQQRAGRPGVRAYRLFQPDGDGAPLLVELGWLPLPGNRAMPDVPRIDGSRHVEGLLAPPPSPGIARSVAVPQANGTLLATSLDPDLLRTALQQARIAPRVLRLDPQSPIGYERDLAMLPNTLPPEKHLGYAVQWFALALAVLATALLLTLRKAKP
jgi:cytochrome oxidase assembly protein ShyY1